MNAKFSTTMTTSNLVFNQLLSEKTPVTLVLDRGEKLSGQLAGWDEHYLLLINESKLQVVPSWRLLWLESDLDQSPQDGGQDTTTSGKTAVLSNPIETAVTVDPVDSAVSFGLQPQPETLVSIPKVIAVTASGPPENTASDAILEIAHESAVQEGHAVAPNEDISAEPQLKDENISPLDHLEQLIKNW